MGADQYVPTGVGSRRPAPGPPRGNVKGDVCTEREAQQKAITSIRKRVAVVWNRLKSPFRGSSLLAAIRGSYWRQRHRHALLAANGWSPTELTGANVRPPWRNGRRLRGTALPPQQGQTADFVEVRIVGGDRQLSAIASDQAVPPVTSAAATIDAGRKARACPASVSSSPPFAPVPVNIRDANSSIRGPTLQRPAPRAWTSVRNR